MRVVLFERVFHALEGAQVRYLVVGDVAAVAHGVMRLTNDLDLVLAFEEENLIRGIRALEAIGFKARLPVTAEAFAQDENRRRWAIEKNMIVFQMALFEADDLPIDIFIEPPFDVEQELARAPRFELAPGLQVPVVHAQQLIAMKQRAGRPCDVEDVETLKRLLSL